MRPDKQEPRQTPDRTPNALGTLEMDSSPADIYAVLSPLRETHTTAQWFSHNSYAYGQSLYHHAQEASWVNPFSEEAQRTAQALLDASKKNTDIFFFNRLYQLPSVEARPELAQSVAAVWRQTIEANPYPMDKAKRQLEFELAIDPEAEDTALNTAAETIIAGIRRSEDKFIYDEGYVDFICDTLEYLRWMAQYEVPTANAQIAQLTQDLIDKKVWRTAGHAVTQDILKTHEAAAGEDALTPDLFAEIAADMRKRLHIVVRTQAGRLTQDSTKLSDEQITELAGFLDTDGYIDEEGFEQWLKSLGFTELRGSSKNAVEKIGTALFHHEHTVSNLFHIRMDQGKYDEAIGLMPAFFGEKESLSATLNAMGDAIVEHDDALYNRLWNTHEARWGTTILEQMDERERAFFQRLPMGNALTGAVHQGYLQDIEMTEDMKAQARSYPDFTHQFIEAALEYPRGVPARDYAEELLAENLELSKEEPTIRALEYRHRELQRNTLRLLLYRNTHQSL